MTTVAVRQAHVQEHILTATSSAAQAPEVRPELSVVLVLPTDVAVGASWTSSQ